MADVFFATNRDIRREHGSVHFGPRFHRDGPQFFRVGEAEVVLRPGGHAGVDRDWSVPWVVLEAEASHGGADGLGSSRLFERLRRALKDGNRDVLILIHGFASSFPQTAIRAAQLARAYAPGGVEPVVFFFSWPSNGRMVPAADYVSDREDAAMSGLAMARALERLIGFLEDLRREDRALLMAARTRGDASVAKRLKECRRSINLVAHSMGNWALGHAVEALAAARGRRLPRLFDHVFLMAADADEDALMPGGRLWALPRLARQVHVYHASNDQALMISDRTKGNPDRLGSGGPSGLDGLDPRILTIDCAEVSRTPSIRDGRHQYHRLRREVIEDVRMTLEGLPPEHSGRQRVVTRPGRSWRLMAS